MPNPLGDSPRRSPASLGVFPVFLMILPGLLAAGISLILANFPVPESPRNRQIILDVPEKSSVNAQVTSQDNTINLQNL
jgi:hypothetical protein